MGFWCNNGQNNGQNSRGLEAFWGHSGAFWKGARMTAREGPWGRERERTPLLEFFFKCVNDCQGKARQGE